ncbi:SDR family oxidoreductase [Candidatus Dependentiae bacterium]|nr:SDR family oxidoreductase [Candidatus Dependentiae bacterium]
MSETVLITGASGGIGLEFAKQFAEDEYNLVLVARSEDKLKDIKNNFEKEYNVKVDIIKKDLSLLQSAPELFNEVKDRSLKIDILINNAGFGVYGLFKDVKIEPALDMINLNITAVTYLTKLFLDEMIKNNKGKIMNVASTASFQPGPYMSVYYASKAFVLFFTEALDEELRGTGISVSAFCPGPTETGFQKNADMSGVKTFSFSMPVEKVVRIGYKQFMRNKRIIIPGFINKLYIFGERFTPRWLVIRFLKSLQKKR